MHEKIADIQNSFWKAYKDFIKTGDMGQLDKDMDRILEKYQNNGVLLSACKWFSGGWAIIADALRREQIK